MSTFPDSPTLAALLLPADLSTFFREHWERRPLLVRASDSRRFRSLIALGDIDALVTTMNLEFPQIRVAKGDEPPRREEFTLEDGRIDPIAAVRLFAAGTTLILDHLDQRVPSLGALCRRLDAELGMSFQTNVYVTPPKARGFKVHYDTHDVFVLQVEGTKAWELFDAPIQLPLRGQPHETCGAVPGAVAQRFTLEPGDLVYIPRGYFHHAATGDSLSVHITLGASTRTWADFFVEAASDVFLRDVEFRRGLPPGFLLPEYDEQSARAEFERLKARLIETLTFDAAFRSHRADFVQSRDAHLPNHLLQVSRLARLNGECVVAKRAGIAHTEEPRHDRFVVRFLNAEIDFPAPARETVHGLLSGMPLRIREAPGPLDPCEKLAVARRLVLDGLLEWSEDQQSEPL